MVAKDAGWAALAAIGFCMLCAFSIWGDVSGEALFKRHQGRAALGTTATQAAAPQTPLEPGQP